MHIFIRENYCLAKKLYLPVKSRFIVVREISALIQVFLCVATTCAT